MLIETNCIINGMPEEVYHADPTPVVKGFVDNSSASSTTLNALIEETEIEGRMTIKRLNPNKKNKKNKAMDLGTLAHDYVLSGGTELYEIAPYNAWQSKDAKAAKADIESRGKIALNINTQSIVKDLQNMKSRLLEQIKDHKDWAGIFDKGKPEQSAFAFDGEIWNRIRIDWLLENYVNPHGLAIEHVIVDYKTTALPFDRWEKNELWNGKYVQNVHYKRTLDLITGTKCRFIYVVQQTVEPFLVQIFEIDESYTGTIESRYDMARKKFINCLKTGVWKGIMPYTAYSTPPPWVENKWEMDSLNDDMLRRLEKDALKKAEEPPKDVSMAG